jgi:hypothetical protein
LYVPKVVPGGGVVHDAWLSMRLQRCCLLLGGPADVILVFGSNLMYLAEPKDFAKPCILSQELSIEDPQTTDEANLNGLLTSGN